MIDLKDPHRAKVPPSPSQLIVPKRSCDQAFRKCFGGDKKQLVTQQQTERPGI